MTLLSCVEDPIGAREELSAKERGWLLKARDRLGLDDDDLYDVFSRAQLRRAQATYALLTAT